MTARWWPVTIWARPPRAYPIIGFGMDIGVGGVMDTDRHEMAETKEQSTMTGLGAALYGGFFGLAALWLFLTADRGAEPDDVVDQAQRPDLSNSDSASAAHVGSRPCSASQASLK
jgi:hypothetical protein